MRPKYCRLPLRKSTTCVTFSRTDTAMKKEERTSWIRDKTSGFYISSNAFICEVLNCGSVLRCYLVKRVLWYVYAVNGRILARSILKMLMDALFVLLHKSNFNMQLHQMHAAGIVSCLAESGTRLFSLHYQWHQKLRCIFPGKTEKRHFKINDWM